MNEIFCWQRYWKLFKWSWIKQNLMFRIAILIFVFIQLGWYKSKLNPIDSMNNFIASSLIVINIGIFQSIAKRGVAHFLLLPATVFEKFLYVFTAVFCGAFAFSFLMYAFAELSSRVLFSVSHDWFAFDSSFAIWMVFTTSILFFIQFLVLKKSNAKALAIVFSVIIVTACIFIDNYFIEHFAQYTPFRLWLYTLLSVVFIGAAYLKFAKCEATFQHKTTVLK